MTEWDNQDRDRSAPKLMLRARIDQKNCHHQRCLYMNALLVFFFFFLFPVEMTHPLRSFDQTPRPIGVFLEESTPRGVDLFSRRNSAGCDERLSQNLCCGRRIWRKHDWDSQHSVNQVSIGNSCIGETYSFSLFLFFFLEVIEKMIK